MRKICLTLASLALLPVPLAFADSTYSVSVEMQQGGLDALLASVRSGELVTWPFIYYNIAPTSSVAHAANQEQLDFQETVEPLLADLATLCSQTVNSASDTFYEMSALLKWRNLLYQYPTYGNLLLAEAANRVLIVKLADKSMVMDQSQRKESQRLVHEARVSCIPLDSWRIIVDQNVHQKGIDKIANNISSDPEGHSEKCIDLWKELDRQDEILSPEDSACASLYDLMNKPNLPLLLHRYVMTDSFFRKLEMVYIYMDLEVSASIKDGFDEVSRVFPVQSHRRYQITSEGIKTSKVSVPVEPEWCVEEAISKNEFSAFQVAALLQVIDSNQLTSSIPFFYNYPDMTVFK